MISKNVTEKIVDKIIEVGKLDGLPEPAMSQFKNNMEAQILRRLGLIIISNLEEKDIDEYEAMLKSGSAPDPAELQRFLEGKIPNYEEKIKQEMDDFIKEIVANMNK
jgi:hypothetical protein